jgi:sRNA-binding regulator protein Hfq
MPAHEVVKTKITSACHREVITDPKTLQKIEHQIKVQLEQAEQLSIDVTFQSREASCTASTCIIQVFLKYNTKHSSTCADYNQFPSILNQEREQHLCYKTACSPVC